MTEKQERIRKRYDAKMSKIEEHELEMKYLILKMKGQVNLINATKLSKKEGVHENQV